MGSLSNYGENYFLDHIFNSGQTLPGTVYLCLCTADPTDAATGASMNEVANANGYVRTAITFGAPSTRRTTQSAIVTFPQASGAWGTVTHWAICDSNTYGAGNVLAHGAFGSSFSPVSGNTPSVASGQVYVEITAIANIGFTTACVHNMLSHMFRNTSYTSPAGNTFIALLNAVGADSDSTMADCTEVSGTGYAREEVNPNGGGSPAWTSASAGAISNGGAITFDTPGAGGWTQVVGIAIVDALTGTAANVLAYDNSNVVDQTPAQNDTVQFADGALDISMS